MKRIVGLIAALLLAGVSYGQVTSIAALVSDTSGTNWSNGSYTITFVPVPGNPGPYNYNGAPFVPQAYTGTMDAGGNLAITLPSTNFIFPSGTQWKFTVCPQASSPCHVVNSGVSGATIDLTATLSNNNIPVTFPATPLQFGYNDAEAKPQPGVGQIYYNVGSTATRQWNGSAWQNLGGGSSSFTLTTTGTTGASSFSTGVLNIPIYQGQLSLTTTGTSGPATLAGNIINIPQYSGGGSSGVSSLNSLTGGLVITGGTNLTVTPSGSSIALVPNVTGLVTPGTNVTITGAGTSGSPYVVNASSSGASNAFSAITNGINTTAAMQCGSGCSISPTGTGTIVSTNGLINQLSGYAVEASSPTDAIVKPFPMDDAVSTANTVTVHKALAVTDGTGNGGTVNALEGTEGTPQLPTSGHDIEYADNTLHRKLLSNDGDGYSPISTLNDFAGPPAIGNVTPAPFIGAGGTNPALIPGPYLGVTGVWTADATSPVQSLLPGDTGGLFPGAYGRLTQLTDSYIGWERLNESLGAYNPVGHQVNVNDYSVGIHSGIALGGYWHGANDTIGFNNFGVVKQGWLTGASQGYNAFSDITIESPEYTGTVLTGGSGATTLTLTPVTNATNLGPLSPLLDLTTIVSTTAVMSGSVTNGLATLTIGATVGVSTTGTLASNCVSPQLHPNNTGILSANNVTCTLNTATLLTTGDLVGFGTGGDAGVDHYEVVQITNVSHTGSGPYVQTISGTMFYSHSAGTTFYDGGAVGSYLVETANASGGNLYPYYIVGSTGAHTILVGVVAQGSFQFNAFPTTGTVNVAMYQGADIVGVVNPSTHQPDGGWVAITASPTTAFAAGHSVINANNLSAAYQTLTSAQTINNQYAWRVSILGFWAGLGGSKNFGNSANGFIEFIDSHPATTYYGAGGSGNAPWFHLAVGPVSSYVVGQYAPLPTLAGNVGPGGCGLGGVMVGACDFAPGAISAILGTGTAYSITSGVATFTATNALSTGDKAMLLNFPTATFFNTSACTVLSSGLSSSQFEVTLSACTPSITHADASATESFTFGTPQDTATLLVFNQHGVHYTKSTNTWSFDGNVALPPIDPVITNHVQGVSDANVLNVRGGITQVDAGNIDLYGGAFGTDFNGQVHLYGGGFSSPGLLVDSGTSSNHHNGYVGFGYAAGGVGVLYPLSVVGIAGFGCIQSAGTCAATIDASGNIAQASGLVHSWNSDTGLSRDAAATVDVGNGTAGDKSGSLNAALVVAGTSINSPSYVIPAAGTATGGGNFSSAGGYGANGSYWTGSVANTDSWSWSNVLGTGSNPTSTLTFAHSGSSGVASISLPLSTTITQSAADSSTKLATTFYADRAVSNAIQEGTTGSIGGSLLTAGTCATGTATVTNSEPAGSPVAVSASDGSAPNALVTLSGYVTTTGTTVTVQVCAIAAVTPAAKTYNVAVF